MKNFKKLQEDWERKNLSPLAKKSAESMRWKEDEPDPYRTEYQRDVGRIIYCDAFRRLRMKTQVFTASGLDQHNRTRLTHTIEVAQIAKSIARPLKLNVDLTEAIALGHDLGHTPFGHAGEHALRQCLGNKGTFSHNAQSVWIVRRHLYNRTDIFGNSYCGLNLTYDTVEGIWKHTDDLYVEEFEDLKYLRPGSPCHLEGQVVDLADGIAYLKHDIDDSIRNGLMSIEELKNIWNMNTDLPFTRNWFYHLIYDAIQYSEAKEKISFSPEVQNIYKTIKTLVKEKILNSEPVKKADNEGKEIITAIYEYCNKNPEYVISKYPCYNKYIYDQFGIERLVIDYIQWLGDETARAIYNNKIFGSR